MTKFRHSTLTFYNVKKGQIATKIAYRIEHFFARYLEFLRDLGLAGVVLTCRCRRRRAAVGGGVYPPLAASLRDSRRSGSNAEISGRFFIWNLKIGDVFSLFSKNS